LYFLPDIITDDETDGGCGTYGEEEKCIQSFGGETKEIGHLEDLDVDGRIILKQVLKKIEWLGVDWICLGQVRTWRARVNTVMSLWVP
jgi:hypothetical protein